jgi:cytochrome c553
MAPAIFLRLAAAAFAFPALACAQGSPSAGDAAAGSQKTQMCVGCHGIAGWRTAFPEYRSGARSHPSMRAIATSLSDKDIADLAAYYAGTTVKAASK